MRWRFCGDCSFSACYARVSAPDIAIISSSDSGRSFSNGDSVSLRHPNWYNDVTKKNNWQGYIQMIQIKNILWQKNWNPWKKEGYLSCIIYKYIIYTCNCELNEPIISLFHSRDKYWSFRMADNEEWGVTKMARKDFFCKLELWNGPLRGECRKGSTTLDEYNWKVDFRSDCLTTLQYYKIILSFFYLRVILLDIM